MQASDTFRSRRPPSPHGPRQTLSTGLPTATARFPQPRYVEEGQPILSADDKLEAVRSDPYAHPVTTITTSSHTISGRSWRGGLGRITSGEWKVVAAVLIVACCVRLFRLSYPDSVVFDEVHFGKFAGKYLKTRYYVDVHPPLAKLLITLAAWFGGYNGIFDFAEIGLKFPFNVPYVQMRLVPAIMGVGLVPIAYLTLRALDCSASTALLGSVLVLFENGLITQSRHILLDSPLLFFTGLSTLFWCMFCNEDKRSTHGKGAGGGKSGRPDSGPFSRHWWTYLACTGLSLGAVVSCKWVGLFTIATVGLSTLKQLWHLLGDLSVSRTLFARHFIARALCLIAIPLMFYMAMFEIHFAILRNPGDGDAFMSSEFQHTLDGKGMEATYADVAYGSVITMRHVNTQGGYLHSHAHNYPTGSKQQQITLYPHIDGNNEWRIVPMLDPNAANKNNISALMDHLTYIRPGATIRLEHTRTGKHLHSHDVRPPVSDVDFQNEVSGYGFEGFEGDANDNWIVELDEEGGGGHGGVDGDGKGWGGDRESGKRLRTLRSRFLLRHQLSGCYLFSHKTKLPEWGYEQQEVTCNKNAVRKNSVWYIETNTNPLLPKDAEKVNYKLPGFFGKWWELQKVMWWTNAGLTSRHAYDSRPHHWPWLRRGINFWVRNHRHIYLIGNPFIWWMSSASVLIYAGARALLILRQKRGYKDFHSSAVVKYDQMIGFLVLGWACHYFPFFLMGRQLFLHHYFPALYFSILSCAGLFDLLTSTMSPRRRIQIAAVIMALAIWTYAHFSPMVYGSPWTKKHCTDAKWLKTWDFSCNDYFEDYSKYKTWTPPADTHAIAPTPQAPTVGKDQHQAGKVDNTPAVNAANKAPVKQPDALTEGQGEIREKVEPGRDVFEAHPIDQVNQALEAALTMTGANAPIDPEEKKKLDEELKRKEEQKKKEAEEVEKLVDNVGPLLPSDLARVEEERKKEREQNKPPIGEQMIEEGKKLREQLEKSKKKAAEAKAKALAEKEKLEKAAAATVDPTAVEPVEEEFKIQTAPHEKKEEAADDAE